MDVAASTLVHSTRAHLKTNRCDNLGSDPVEIQDQYVAVDQKNFLKQKKRKKKEQK